MKKKKNVLILPQSLTHQCCFPGGRDTAGLGGKGGPYRLDAGHKVYQVSQAEKDAVPEEVRRAAREMAEKAFKDRFVHIWTTVR